MACPEPQKLPIPRARENPGRRTVPTCPWHGQGQTGLGDKPHCHGFPDPQPTFCNPNPQFFKTNGIPEYGETPASALPSLVGAGC